MISIPKLQAGDQVAIVATARKISITEVQSAIDLLNTWGLQPVIGKTIGAEENQFAGSDAFRLSEIQHMLDNPDIKAIWCARGGYGTVRIIDALNFINFKKSPKWVVGYSDVTVLHSHLHTLGYNTIHAPMAIDIANQNEEALTCLRKALFGETYSINHVTQDPYTRVGMAEGQLVGGNLSILYSLCGSPSAIPTQGKILLLEDLDEYLYHIDRMMQNLKRNGYFENCKGLIVGSMVGMRDNTRSFGFNTDNPYGKTANEIIADAVAAYNFPVCFDFPVGHHNDHRAMILGSTIRLEVNSSFSKVEFTQLNKV